MTVEQARIEAVRILRWPAKLVGEDYLAWLFGPEVYPEDGDEVLSDGSLALVDKQTGEATWTTMLLDFDRYGAMMDAVPD